MRIHSDLADTIGNTPLLKLKQASEMTGCTILGKCEFLNPGQSVKDRAALYIIRDAVAKGLLKPGGTIVEGTAGNTGIGLALVGAVDGVSHGDRDPRDAKPGKEGHAAAGGGRTGAGAGGALPQPQQLCALFRPSGRGAGADRTERRDLGQPVRQRGEPSGAYRNHRAGDLGPDRRQGRRLHLRGGLGRHAGGRGDGLAAQGREDRSGRPGGCGAACLLHHRQAGKPRHRRSPKASGRGGSPPTWKASPPISAIASPMPRRCRIVFDLLEDEGLCMGGSSGINIAGAIRMARDMGPGKTIVTILCDYGNRYQSKLFNPAFLQRKGPAGAGLAGPPAPRRFRRSSRTHEAVRRALAAVWRWR